MAPPADCEISRKSNKRIKLTVPPERKEVRFASNLETVHYLPEGTILEDGETNESGIAASENNSQQRKTSELTVLSSVHGRARRYLRDITKFDLQSAIRYGVKKKGHCCPRTKLPRWMYVYGNVVYITDHTSTQEVTSYKEPLKIQSANITTEMLLRHVQDKQALKDDPELCATHSIIIIDQSGSMKAADVSSFRSRSQAAYGVLALEYIAEQLHQRDDQDGILDAVSIIEMNDVGTLVFDREPMDWILFNKILERQMTAKPRSHGNYNMSLQMAKMLIEREIETMKDLDLEDLPSFAIIFLSDGKPSDTIGEANEERHLLLHDLCEKLQSNLAFHAIGLGSSDSDFGTLESMVSTVKKSGVEGTFSFAQLSCADLSSAFSSASKSVTATRTGMFSSEDKTERIKKNVQLREKHLPSDARKFRRFSHGVSRWRYDHDSYRKGSPFPWSQINFKNQEGVGFDMEADPFGKGAERLAYMFHELDQNNKRVGRAMVAKESININTEERKVEFHENFCRVQRKANELAKEFTAAVKKTPSLWPVDSSMKTPVITFLKCFVYDYVAEDGIQCGLLVEHYLKGKWTKYNSNNGLVYKNEGGVTMDLQIGEVLLTDFLQAFSHWTYFSTAQRVLVCDLQGIFDEEGRHARFDLTDPCICTRGRRGPRYKYGRTDIGMRGIRMFRKTHVCNNVCKGLGLPNFGNRRRRRDGE
jgi:hypothetical protein